MNRFLLAIALSACALSATALAADAKTAKAATGTDAPQTTAHQARGVVQSFDPAQGKISVTHEAVASAGWPAMTMNFKISKELSSTLKVGQRVNFEFVMQGRDAVITKAVAAN